MTDVRLHPSAGPSSRSSLSGPPAPERPTTRPVNVLSIAGSDPSGGAGVQADLKTFSALGGYGLAAVTALTAQNTRGVRAVHVPPPEFLEAQLEALSDDVRIDAVKIGMVAGAGPAAVVAEWLAGSRPPVVVLDPVMVATSGDRLLTDDAVRVLRDRLLPRANLVTPNLPELAVLVDEPVAADWDDAVRQATLLAARSGVRVLLKGGHLPGPVVTDALVSSDGAVTVETAPRVGTRNTHGTGCTLSSAVTVLRARRDCWPTAVAEAKQWLTGALQAADRLDVGGLPGPGGEPHGPVHHFHALWGDVAAGRPGARPAETFTDEAWRVVAAERAGIDRLPFVRELRDGTLTAARFTAYLRQDLSYLDTFARALARCAQLAADGDDQLWWLDHARECLVAEAALHREVLAAAEDPGPGSLTPANRAYQDHLTAAGDRGYPVLASAVLPCFWIYSDLGARLLVDAPAPDHPYRAWIDQYADPRFARATDDLRRLVDRIAADATSAVRTQMLEAFVTSVRYERRFWEDAWQQPTPHL